MTSTLNHISKRDTTLSPYFNHELLGAVINAIATSSILKVAYVWHLKSPLYGQGDAGRVWYRTLHTQLIKQGFARNHNDPCL